MERHTDYKRPEFLAKLLNTLPEVTLDGQGTALLVIDMQYVDASRDYGLGEKAYHLGLTDYLEYYFERLENLVVPNIKTLQQAFRDRGREVIFAKIESLTEDGRDRSLPHKHMGIQAKPGSQEGKILEEIAPQSDEIVLPKSASGVFNSTNIDYLLKNLGITQLVITGVLTNECVETACRNAADRGYEVILVEDACAALTPDLHRASLVTLQDVYARVKTTEEMLNLI